MSRSPRLDLPERIRDKATLARVASLRPTTRTQRLIAECAEWAMSLVQDQIAEHNSIPCSVCGGVNPNWKAVNECPRRWGNETSPADGKWR